VALTAPTDVSTAGKRVGKAARSRVYIPSPNHPRPPASIIYFIPVSDDHDAAAAAAVVTPSPDTAFARTRICDDVRG